MEGKMEMGLPREGLQEIELEVCSANIVGKKWHHNGTTILVAGRCAPANYQQHLLVSPSSRFRPGTRWLPFVGHDLLSLHCMSLIS